MARTIEIQLFQLSELTDEARKRAIDAFRNAGDCWAWGDEWWDSAQAFSRIAPINIRDADYDRRQVSVEWAGVSYANRFDHDDAIRELSGLRAWKWLENNGWFAWAENERKGACSMTGYCGDAPFGDAIAAYARKPLSVPDIEQVFYEAAQAWVCEAADDCERAYSDEAIAEQIECNEFEFTADGKLA